MGWYRIDFEPVDTWFFRGTRPHAAAGAAMLPSDFPPSPSTLSGAVRTRLGEALGLDWQRVEEDEQGQITQGSGTQVDGADAAEIIGSSRNTGQLVFGHPRVRMDQERLFPVPSMYLRDREESLVSLVPGEVVHCDLGRVRLPEMRPERPGAKGLEGHWLTESGLKAHLAGDAIPEQAIIDPGQLFSHEPRLGIARNNDRNTVRSGMLYQTQHLRLNRGVGLSVCVQMPDSPATILLESLQAQPLQRLGGEGRMAAMRMSTIEAADELPEAPEHAGEGTSLILTLASDALFESGQGPAMLPGFEAEHEQGVDRWRGTINGVELSLETAVCAKAVRHGGWDMRNGQPRTVASYTPAGSCFFVRVHSHDPASAFRALHGVQIGARTDHGFGQVLCARPSHQ